MPSVIVVGLVSLICLYGFSQFRALRRNIAAAKSSGFRYVVSPVFFNSIPWIIFQELLLPALSKLPASWTESWLPLSLFYRIWHAGYEPFAKVGEEAFLVVSPRGIVLWTCDPHVNMQIMNRHKDFPKATDMLSILNLYGPTITASEGEEHRLYRSIAAPSFNEAMHGRVWATSSDEAAKITAHWDKNGGCVENVVEDSTRFALHVLSRVIYGREMTWGENEQVPKNHKLPFGKACSDAFKYNDVLFFTPMPVLNISPIQRHKDAKLAFVEFRKYLVEMREETAARLKLGKPSPDESSLLVNFVMAGTPGLQTDVSLSIPTPAVLGNLFIFILAGHETSANLMANAITLLALKPDYQRAMQTEIDNIFLDQKTSQISSYTTTFTRLLDGRVGALMKEILRLYSVLPFIVKSVPGNPQTLTMEDEKRIVPTGTVIFINTSATHRSPRHWPLPREPRVPGEESPYPLSSFYPERWLPNIISASRNIDDERFDPTPGSYIPFSEGFRSCIGTRFSKIEVCAVIAHVFREYSIQLVNGDSAEALREVARNMSSGIKFEMGLKQGRSTPLRFVKRGV